MGEIRLFHQVYGQVFCLENNPFPTEKPLHEQIEKHLLEYLGVCFLAREVMIGASELDSDEEGRIDTLGVDSDGRPVIVEYKRGGDRNVVQQILDYREWLLKNKPMFRELVRETNQDCAEKTVWQPRLVVIAGEFSDRNKREARRAAGNASIELVRYRRFGDEFLALEWVFGESAVITSQQVEKTEPEPKPAQTEFVVDNGKPFSVNWDWQRANEDLQSLCLELRAFAKSLGDDVRVDAFPSVISVKRVVAGRKRSPVFAYVHLRTKAKAVTLDIPTTPPGEQRRYQGVSIRNAADLERAKPLLLKAYENG